VNVCFCCIRFSFFQYYVRRLAQKNVWEMTYTHWVGCSSLPYCRSWLIHSLLPDFSLFLWHWIINMPTICWCAIKKLLAHLAEYCSNLLSEVRGRSRNDEPSRWLYAGGISDLLFLESLVTVGWVTGQSSGLIQLTYIHVSFGIWDRHPFYDLFSRTAWIS